MSSSRERREKRRIDQNPLAVSDVLGEAFPAKQQPKYSWLVPKAFLGRFKRIYSKTI